MPQESNRSWTLLAVEGPRQYGGNPGYENIPVSTYRFDSSVANSQNVRSGDLAFIRNSEELLGVALIERVSAKEGDKELLRCPVCRMSGIRRRTTMQPAYRCIKGGHEFDEPIREIVRVTKYEAHYGGTFINVSGAVRKADLRSAAYRPNDQLSIEELDAAALSAAVVRAAPAARKLLEQFFQRLMPESEYSDLAVDGYKPQMADRRKKVLASISARRGQTRFRRELMRRYGAACAISGCSLAPILEAAHIWPYRGEEDNHRENGLLLRSDLHTLYDLDLIGVDESLRVRISDVLRGSEYESLDGIVLKLRKKPSAAAIALRWETFCDNGSR